MCTKSTGPTYNGNRVVRFGVRSFDGTVYWEELLGATPFGAAGSRPNRGCEPRAAAGASQQNVTKPHDLAVQDSIFKGGESGDRVEGRLIYCHSRYTNDNEGSEELNQSSALKEHEQQGAIKESHNSQD